MENKMAKILLFRLELVKAYAERELGREVQAAELRELMVKNPEGFRKLVAEATERIAA